jgi:DNA-binding NarL/FixJ family response regulator
MRLVHEGKTNAQIAAERGTSVSAAEKMVGRLYGVLGVDAHASNARAIVARMYGEVYGGAQPDSGR